MPDKNDDKWFLKASRERAEAAERETRLAYLANAIGERRGRDILDIIATIERDEGWSTALQFLIDVADMEYLVPAGFGKAQTPIEPLKYREMIFTLLSCNGLEPVEPETASLIQMLESSDSLATASQTLITHTQELALTQIESGDTLFFDTSGHTTQGFDEITRLLESVRINQITGSVLRQESHQVDITPLWFSEHGRLALSELGIQGRTTSIDQIEMVLSVIQVSPTIRKGISVSEHSEISRGHHIEPSNRMYNNLHQYIMNQDLDGLISYGSSHSLTTLRVMLDASISKDMTSGLSTDYRQVLQWINCHVVVRELDSILPLERLLKTKDIRIITPAITALGNFYHESSVLAIVELVCSQKNESLIKVAMPALENILKKCPEAIPAIRSALESDCVSRKPLRQLLDRFS